MESFSFLLSINEAQRPDEVHVVYFRRACKATVGVRAEEAEIRNGRMAFKNQEMSLQDASCSPADCIHSPESI